MITTRVDPYTSIGIPIFFHCSYPTGDMVTFLNLTQKERAEPAHNLEKCTLDYTYYS